MADERDANLRKRHVKVEDIVEEGKQAKEIMTDEKKEALRPDKPLHCTSDSLLSTSSGYNNYRGLLNLCIVLLALSNGRVALENLLKYGLLIRPLQWIDVIIHEPFHWPSISLMAASSIFVLVTFFIEILLSKKLIPEWLAFQIHVFNICTVILSPAVVVLTIDIHPVGSVLALMVYSCVFMKLVSYVSVNKWCRIAQAKKAARKREELPDANEEEINKLNQNLVEYPDNLTLRDITYFMFAPTLCYELNFPRTTRIRKRFLLNRTIEMLFLFHLNLCLIQQWMVPTIRNSMIPFRGMDYTRTLERLLKLAVPNHFIWLIFFYWFFHSCLNFMAELLRFGDREFYRDWWNAETMQSFWQNWNVPVHRWCVRHLYIPLIKKGCPRKLGPVVVFMVSAFFHEYLVSIPLHMFRTWSFIGMIGQVPLAVFVKRCLSGKYANMAMWISLIIGQPLAILMYYHDYYVYTFDSEKFACNSSLTFTEPIFE